MQARSLSSSSSSKRIVSVALVAAIHVAAIYTLFLSLTGGISIPTPKGPVTIDIFKTPPPTPLVSDPHVILPTRIPGTEVRPPVIDIDNSMPHEGPTITTPPGGQQVSPTQSSLTPARAIAGTHSIPDYPPIAARLSEQGSVRLSLAIDERGTVVGAAIVTSSGYDALDAAAIAWVKSHWRYEPATRNGTAVSSTTEAIVTFRLTNRQG